ncbi:receptor like protein 27-like [Carex rostrata]
MAHDALVSILLLFSFFIKPPTLTEAHCLPDQRHALIKLEQGFNTTELQSWNASTDCCIWDGITCNEKTGMVAALNLTNRSISGELNQALFNLSSLRYVNLADNNFYNITLPQTGFERLDNLTHLNLSYSGFVGQVPIGISTLRNLILLDLSDFSSTSTNTLYLHDTGLKTFLSNLTNLQVLRLDSVDISLDEYEWGNTIFQVGSALKELSMASCGLRGNFPDEIFHLTNLTKLDLSDNSMLSGQLSEFKKRSLLQSLDLANTNFSGPIPDSIGNLQYLLKLSLFNCNFYGEVPPSITNLTRLEYLNLGSNKLTDLSNNSLSGEILHSICNVTLPSVLDLSYNNLTSTVPPCLLGDTELEVLNLKSNKLRGPLPQNISQACALQAINLNGNLINGKIEFMIYGANRKKRVSELLDDCFPNDMEIKTNGNDSFFPMLKVLDLSSNHFSGTLPKNIFVNLKAMMVASNTNPLSYITYVASISYKGLSLDLINSLGIFSYIDMSNNEFLGRIPGEIGQLKSLDLSGHIPQELTSLTFLSALNLSYNNLVGEIPQDQQFLTFSNASYLGNPGLCVSHLSMQCPTTPSNDGFNKGFPPRSSTDVIELSVSVGLGLGVGFASVIWTLVSWKNGRERFYFRHFY